MPEADIGLVDKGNGLAKVGAPRGGQRVFAEHAGEQQLRETIAIPESESDVAARVAAHVAFDIVPDVLVEIASETQDDDYGKCLVALRLETPDVDVEDLIEGWSKRLCAGVPTGAGEVAWLDGEEEQ